MPQTSAKQQAIDALKNMPESATFEDLMDRLLFLAKIDRGVAEADAGKMVAHEEVKSKYAL